MTMDHLDPTHARHTTDDMGKSRADLVAAALFFLIALGVGLLEMGIFGA